MPAASLLLHEKILNLIQVKVHHDAYLVRLIFLFKLNILHLSRVYGPNIPSL